MCKCVLTRHLQIKLLIMTCIYMHVNMDAHTTQTQIHNKLNHTLPLTLIKTYTCAHKQHTESTSCMIKQTSLGTMLLSYCQILFNNIAKLLKDPKAMMLQLLEKDPLFFYISELNHLHVFRVKTNTELIHSQMPLQLRSSFK